MQHREHGSRRDRPALRKCRHNGNGETRLWTVPAYGGALNVLVDNTFDA